MNPRKEDRNKKALELRRQGLTYKEIGKILGLTKGRVFIIISNQQRWEKEEEENGDG